MSDLRNFYRPRTGITQEQTRDARVRVWAFVLQCWQKKQTVAERALTPDSPNTATTRNEEEGVGHVEPTIQ